MLRRNHQSRQNRLIADHPHTPHPPPTHRTHHPTTLYTTQPPHAPPTQPPKSTKLRPSDLFLDVSIYFIYQSMHPISVHFLPPLGGLRMKYTGEKSGPSPPPPPPPNPRNILKQNLIRQKNRATANSMWLYIMNITMLKLGMIKVPYALPMGLYFTAFVTKWFKWIWKEIIQPLRHISYRN